MEVVLDHISKRYLHQKVIRDLNFRFENGKRYAIRGPNGSGKSTLLKIISGYLSPSSGKITYYTDGEAVSREYVFHKVGIVSVESELIEEFTLSELLRFQSRFKPWLDGMNEGDILELSGLRVAADKKLAEFSSGMKQRVKLICGILGNASLLLLDEPGTNLDNASRRWYREFLDKWARDRTVVIASNQEEDFVNCGEGPLLTPV